MHYALLFALISVQKELECPTSDLLLANPYSDCIPVSSGGIKYAPSGEKMSKCSPKNVIRDPPAAMPSTGRILFIRGILSGAVDMAVSKNNH